MPKAIKAPQPGVRVIFPPVMKLTVEMATVPFDVLIHHGRRRRMRRNVFHGSFASQTNVSTITQAFSVISAGSHHLKSG